MSILDCIIREKQLFSKIISNRKENTEELVNYYKQNLNKYNEIIFVGSGSSNTSSVAAYQIVEFFSGLSCSVILPNIFINKSCYNPNTLYIFISQTGSSTLTQKAIQKMNTLGNTTVAISESSSTKCAKEANLFVNMGCEEEEYGMRTIGYSTTILTELIIGLELGLANGHLSQSQYDQYINEAYKAINNHQYVIDSTLNWYESVKNTLLSTNHFILLGAKSLYGVALEGALKILETAKKFTAVGYELDDGLHGPNMALKKGDTILVLCDNISDINLAHGIANYMNNEVSHAYIIGKPIINSSDFDFNFVSSNFLAIEFAPIVQILAYKLAIDSGIEVPLFKDLYLPDQKYFNTHSEHLGK